MIAAFSTSSPFASVALLSDNGELLDSWQGEAPRNASAACIEQLLRMTPSNRAITKFIADIGPGSFTGVRVGVMLAKAMAWTKASPVAGVTSFDLVAPNDLVSLPGRRGEWLVREPGQPVRGSFEFEGLGYGTGTDRLDYPNAANVAALFRKLNWVNAMDLLPEYHLAPSISTPKTPYRTGVSPSD